MSKLPPYVLGPKLSEHRNLEKKEWPEILAYTKKKLEEVATSKDKRQIEKFQENILDTIDFYAANDFNLELNCHIQDLLLEQFSELKQKYGLRTSEENFDFNDYTSFIMYGGSSPTLSKEYLKRQYGKHYDKNYDYNSDYDEIVDCIEYVESMLNLMPSGAFKDIVNHISEWLENKKFFIKKKDIIKTSESEIYKISIDQHMQVYTNKINENVNVDLLCKDQQNSTNEIESDDYCIQHIHRFISHYDRDNWIRVSITIKKFFKDRQNTSESSPILILAFDKYKKCQTDNWTKRKNRSNRIKFINKKLILGPLRQSVYSSIEYTRNIIQRGQKKQNLNSILFIDKSHDMISFDIEKKVTQEDQQLISHDMNTKAKSSHDINRNLSHDETNSRKLIKNYTCSIKYNLDAKIKPKRCVGKNNLYVQHKKQSYFLFDIRDDAKWFIHTNDHSYVDMIHTIHHVISSSKKPNVKFKISKCLTSFFKDQKSINSTSRSKYYNRIRQLLLDKYNALNNRVNNVADNNRQTKTFIRFSYKKRSFYLVFI
ncbi:hypothetical protein C1645_882520 [Glomus cerebriforme]|uniref:Uncharacterized protein n=1 Tax=Glomus cerebriforme TaxID=658196 RepID=A0A397SBP0_9GLOM|nr:hypothetical protein C1645_882520 [Glomus cerebriforme]